MIKNIFSLVLAITSCALVSSCSNRAVTTNLDKDNFTHYFSASMVDVYNSEKEIASPYRFIGAVEGQDCQVKPHHATPDEINARTQARQQAFKMQANGVVFTGCALLTHEQLLQLNNSNDAQQCYAVVVCYAKAYAISVK